MSVHPVPSPCIRCCCLGLDDVCMGCGRLLGEITGWQAASDDEKQNIVQRAHERLKAKQSPRIPSNQQVPE